MKIAITGGAGFIGTQLAGVLKEQGHDLLLLDLQPSAAFPDESQIVDITDGPALTKALQGVDAVYHLAAEHRDDVSPVQKYYDVNVGGGENVIAAAKANAIQSIIFTSTVAVYPLSPEDPENGSAEIHTPAPFNDYGRSKLESEKNFEAWADEDTGRMYVGVRLVATFGAGNRGNIFTLINQIAGRKFVMIGNGQNRKSIAYVGNVAGFLAHCLTFPTGRHLYNYADKPDLNMHDFVVSVRHALGKTGSGLRLPYAFGLIGGFVFDGIAKITGRKFPISRIRVQKFCANTVVDAKKRQETGFNPIFSLEKGLEEMIKADFLDKKVV